MFCVQLYTAHTNISTTYPYFCIIFLYFWMKYKNKKTTLNSNSWHISFSCMRYLWRIYFNFLLRMEEIGWTCSNNNNKTIPTKKKSMKNFNPRQKGWSFLRVLSFATLNFQTINIRIFLFIDGGKGGRREKVFLRIIWFVSSIDHCLSFCHCVICPSIGGFWLPHWHP